jgi:tetratricopeptide (TPR) repeat protein
MNSNEMKIILPIIMGLFMITPVVVKAQGQQLIQGNGSALYEAGLRESLGGDYEGALLLYHKALIIDPYNTYSLNGIAKVLYILGNYTGSLKYSDKTCR